MKPFFLLLSFLVLSITGAAGLSSESDVYICQGKYSKKYHYTQSCRGLSNCKALIIKVTLSEAKHKGRTLCGWED